MRRPVVMVAVAFAIAALAPAAQARLVYVRHAATAHPKVWTARDNGRHRHRLGSGRFPVVTADGRLVSWLRFAHRDSVWLARANGKGRPHRLLRARAVGDVAFSPDGALLAAALSKRLVIYDTSTRKRVASLRARVRGLAFSPDSQSIVYGRASSNRVGTPPDFGAPLDLFTATIGGAPQRLTTDGRSLNPAWGGDGTIVFDRMRVRRDDAPVFQLWSVVPGAAAEQITHMHVPSLLSGLVPLELAADGRHLLAEFEGQDTSLGYTVDLQSGRIRALSRRFENGFVAFDLSDDGRTVLGMSGGPDPGGRHDVVTVPFRGGRPHVLVRNAAYPRWSD